MGRHQMSSEPRAELTAATGLLTQIAFHRAAHVNAAGGYLKAWTGICYSIISYHIIICLHREHEGQRCDLQAGEIKDSASSLQQPFLLLFHSL